MKKNISILFLIAFIIPSVAFASWWNPFSWFKSEVPVVAPKIEQIVTPQEDNLNLSDNQPSVNESTIKNKVVKPEENVKEKNVKTPTIQTVTIQDSTLQERIKQLELENHQLKLKIENLNSLQQQIQKLKEEIEALKNKSVFSKEKECEIATDFINSIAEKAKDLIERRDKEISDYMKNSGTKLQSEIEAIKNKYRAEGNQIDKELEAARTKSKVYCN